MTITDADKDQFQSQIGDFHAQHHDDQCYPAALKNIIDRLAERTGRSGMSLSLSDVDQICGYEPGLGCEEELIPGRLTQALSEFGYEAVEETAPTMNWDQLNEIITDDNTSLPIVELDGEYFEKVMSYHGQPSKDGYRPHVVIPMKVNSDDVLFYDPYENHFENRPGIDQAPYQWGQTEFFELWSGESEERWTLWLARRGHKITDTYSEGGEE